MALLKALGIFAYLIPTGLIARFGPERTDMAGRRHASGEITAKLAQANEMAAKGKTQREICKALGVSIMTYHRWKKMMNVPTDGHASGDVDVSPDRADTAETDGVLKRLELENSRLRRLVTDMLLDKLRLEDELRARQAAPYGKPSKDR
jgi:putative transposase